MMQKQYGLTEGPEHGDAEPQPSDSVEIAHVSPACAKVPEGVSSGEDRLQNLNAIREGDNALRQFPVFREGQVVDV